MLDQSHIPILDLWSISRVILETLKKGASLVSFTTLLMRILSATALRSFSSMNRFEPDEDYHG